MKRIGRAAASVLGVCMLAACGMGHGADNTLATVVTDRPTPILVPPAATGDAPSNNPPATSNRPATSATTPSAATSLDRAEPEKYAGKAPGWYYFTSPSGKFECGIAALESSIAGCHGTLPTSAPKVPGSGASSTAVAPNSVQLIAGSPARFESLGDPKFHRFDGPATALPYGQVLVVDGTGSSNGLRCSVDEHTGVTCTDQVGHGFTVSDEDFDLH